MRIAAIDIGTNSVHMIIARVHPRGRYEIVDSQKEMVKLGRGGLTEGVLMQDAQDRAISALHRIHKLAKVKQVEEIVAVATSAVREASNGGEFLARIMDEVGLRVQVIRGTEEARLIYLAVREAVDFRRDRGLIIDIGGGSVEFIVGTAKEPLFMRSVKLGVARLKEMFVSRDPFSPRELRAMRSHVRTQLLPIQQQIDAAGGFQRVLGTSGTILNLCAMANAAEGYEFDTKDGLELDRKALKGLAKRLSDSTPKTREKLPEFDEKRGELTVVGAVLLDEIFDVLDVKALTGCDRALREGVILDYVERHRPDLAIAENETDTRRRSARGLLARYHGNEAHAERTVRFALQLFDATRSLHRLRDEDRDLLELGAWLHDIGYHISEESHHKHTYYLITQSRLAGFTAEAQQFVGLLGRYHRKGKPKLDHLEYQALAPPDRQRLKVLAALLKIADGLDRSHSGVVKQLEVKLEPRRLRMTLRSEEDAELEVWAAARNGELFGELFGRPVFAESKPMPPKQAKRAKKTVAAKATKARQRKRAKR
ncbi:MAG: Ppx/GppA family phosphatase [Deltaproteobacteria bacterium]|nr:Ppx/GppA family phosphatase [Deltaproteobacteria bacterium]